jgi:hypothetical protein
MAGKNAAAQKKTPAEAGVQSLRQVSYRQETYRAVRRLYSEMPPESKLKV